ncbi:MAG TPA: tRNA 2-thiocytidine biosynthesis TtcA family protein [Methanomicrobiales archaeon]|nr:tRNA 2-thiocytidine biosynthesis TtcA family protein [Methanomicrobiales archaeon]
MSSSAGTTRSGSPGSPTGGEPTAPGAGGPLPACDLCGGDAVFLDRVRGCHLCADHLLRDVEGRVRRTVRDYRMVRPAERIAVALSGGKDSTVLLHLLRRIVPLGSDITLTAVTVDEGIAGYREATMRVARETAEKLGVEHHVVSFREIAGSSLDDLVAGGGHHPCSLCGIHRREALRRVAGELGATALATGHNLNDEAQTVVMNCLRGDLPGFTRPPVREPAEGRIRRIKPLFRIPEKEVALYAMLAGTFHDLPECPYAGTALRSEARRMLDRLEYLHPGTLGRVVRGQEEVAALWGRRQTEG